MIGEIKTQHFKKILIMNEKFVHWLAPLNDESLRILLDKATYKKQINNGAGVLIGFSNNADYDHKNLRWLRSKFTKFFYIDRVIINTHSQGQGLAKKLYDDFTKEALSLGIPRLVCEVNTKPNNEASHKFHIKNGFKPVEDVHYKESKISVRYYEKFLLDD